MTDARSVSPAGGPQVVAVTDQQLVADDVQRLAAAVGVDAMVVPDALSAVAWWNRAQMVLLDEQAVQQLLALSLPRRSRTVVVTRGHADPALWRSAMEAGATTVVELPSGDSWLVEAIAAAVWSSRATAPVVTIVGARGGAGASVLSVALARTVVDEGLAGYLVDLDPSGCGLNVVLGVDGSPGVGWSDLQHTTGRIPPQSLREGLPAVAGVRLLTWSEPPWTLPPPGVASSVLDAAARDADLVVVDLSRGLLVADSSAGLCVEVLTRSDHLLVVCPADIRAAIACQRLLEIDVLRDRPISLVVRGPAPGALTGQDLHEALGVPVLVSMSAEPGLDRSLEDGLPPGRARRSPLRSAARVILEHVARSAAEVVEP